MKIIVVGATGIIGGKVVETLSIRHEVLGVARGTEVKVNLEEPATIRALFEHVQEVDAVIRKCGVQTVRRADRCRLRSGAEE